MFDLKERLTQEFATACLDEKNGQKVMRGYYTIVAGMSNDKSHGECRVEHFRVEGLEKPEENASSRGVRELS
jgi:hypothetical protein